MYMSINYSQCLYLNAEKQNSKLMLNDCIGGSDNLSWPCDGHQYIDNSILSRNLERPSGDNTDNKLLHSLISDNQLPKNQQKNPLISQNIEGFTNMGENYVPNGECPDGYYWCPYSQKCKQICMDCKFNEKKYKKSKEFNEHDPCFPNNGVYDGIDNNGVIQCTCGKNNQYCNDIFDSQGGLLVDNVYIMNVGDYGFLGDLASY